MQKGIEDHVQITHNGFKQGLSNNVHKVGAFRRNGKIWFSSVSGLISKWLILKAYTAYRKLLT